MNSKWRDQNRKNMFKNMLKTNRVFQTQGRAVVWMFRWVALPRGERRKG